MAEQCHQKGDQRLRQPHQLDQQAEQDEHGYCEQDQLGRAFVDAVGTTMDSGKSVVVAR